MTTSQPYLDDISGEFSSGSVEKKRRLSSSLDCLQTAMGLEESLTLTSGDSASNLDRLQAEPYLRPVEIRQVVEKQDSPRKFRSLLSLSLSLPLSLCLFPLLYTYPCSSFCSLFVIFSPLFAFG